MDNLIERYVNDVVRRLPEKDREEVSRELKANIYDMIPDNADENDIRSVLNNLGSPASLAEKYRQKPRYLISPAIYDEYVRVLKWLLPLVGIVVLTIGMIFGAIDAIKDGMVDFTYLISNTFSKGFSLGLSAVFQALVWTTVGFVIAERTGAYAGESKNKEWKIEDLPEVLPDKKDRIPLSDSIIELVIIGIFSVVAILACAGVLPIVFTIQNEGTIIRNLFSASFLTACIPAFAIMALLGIGECIAKIRIRRWTPLVCSTVIVSNLASMGIWLYLVTRPNILSEEFDTFLQGIEWGNFDLLRFMGTSINPLPIIIIACSLTGCFISIYKTLKYQRNK